jgi:AAA domain
MKYAVSGAQSVGKTTVVNKIKEMRPEINIVREAARDCPFPLNEKSGLRSQEWIFRQQIKREMEYPVDSIILSDRATYDQLAYVMAGHKRGNMTEGEAYTLHDMLTYWGHTYDFIFYIPIEFELVHDSVRSKDKKYQIEIDEIIKDAMDTFVEHRRKKEIKGTVEERADKILETIDKMEEKSTWSKTQE